MSLFVGNRTKFQLVADLSADALTMTVPNDVAWTLPQFAAGGSTHLVLVSASTGGRETLTVTAVDGYSLTFTRGASPLAFKQGDIAFIPLSASDLVSKIRDTTASPSTDADNMILANNVFGYLSRSITSAATELHLRLVDAQRFPTISGSGFWYPIIVVGDGGEFEVMRVTGSSNGLLTVVRGQEYSTAISFSSGAKVYLALTSSVFSNLYSKADVSPDTHFVDANMVLGDYGRSRLAGPIGAKDTTIRVEDGHGDRFPAITGSQWFPLALTNTYGQTEFVRVTDRSGDTMVIARSKEGSIAYSFGVGSLADHRLTLSAIHATQGWTAQEQKDEQGV